MKKFIAACLLFPTAFFAAAEAVSGFAGLVSGWKVTFSFLGGAALYCLVHYLVSRFTLAYVFAHEVAHALAALVCGIEVRGMSVGKSGGHVTLNGSNAFVSLAPYCFPVYAACVPLVYALLSVRFGVADYRSYFTGAVGFFLAFHLLHTFESLYEQKQSDLRKAGGVLFSVAVILLANSVALLIAARLLYPELISVRMAAARTWHRTAAFWPACFKYAAAGLKAALAQLHPAGAAGK